MNGLWDRPDVPHKGWVYKYTIDYLDEYGDYTTCEMCGKEHIRFVHVLIHKDFEGEIKVGCICAGKMLDEYVDLKEHERQLLRKHKIIAKNFTKSYWRFNPLKDTYSMKIRGEWVTIKKTIYGNYGIVFRDEWKWDIPALNVAKYEAFKLVSKYLGGD